MSLKIPEYKLRSELCKRNFYFFLKEFIYVTIKDDVHFGWHMKYLCDKAQEYGECVLNDTAPHKDYLLINVPPGTSKSTIFVQFLPLWIWINNPTKIIITLSYSQPLSVRHAMRSRDVLRDNKFKLYFPYIQVRKDDDNKNSITLTSGGKRIVTSVGGSVTGEHGHIIIVDDPMNVEQSSSEAERGRANDFVRHTLPSRKKNKENTPTLIIMQRLHELDTSGMLLSELYEQVEHICLPAEKTKDVHPKDLGDNYINGLLDDIRFTNEILNKTKKQLGAYHYAGQYLQIPAPIEGGIIKRNNFKIIDVASMPKLTVNYYVDSAYTEDERNDPSVFLACVYDKHNLYIVSVYRKHVEFPQMQKDLIKFCRETDYDVKSIIKVEPKASGKSLVQTMKTTGLNIKEFTTPTKDKTARLLDVLSFIQSERVYLVRAGWNDEFIQECITFPNGAHDDQLDCLVMAAKDNFTKKGLQFF